MVQSQLYRAFWIQVLAIALLIPGFGCISFFPRTINEPENGETVKRVESLESRVFELENRLGVPTVIPSMPPSDPPGLTAPQSSLSGRRKSVGFAAKTKSKTQSSSVRRSSDDAEVTFSKVFPGGGNATVSTTQTGVTQAARQGSDDATVEGESTEVHAGVEHAAGTRSLSD